MSTLRVGATLTGSRDVASNRFLGHPKEAEVLGNTHRSSWCHGAVLSAKGISVHNTESAITLHYT